MRSVDEMQRGVERAFHELLARDGDDVVILVGRCDGSARSGAERTRAWRERKRGGGDTCDVTPSQVTIGDGGSDEGDASDGGDADQRREDQKRLEEREPPVVPPLGGALGEGSRPARTRKRQKPSEPTPEELAIVERVIAKLNERSGRQFEATAKPTVRLIVRLLRDNRSEHDLRLVVWDRANEWAADPEKAEWLRPSTLFGPEKFSDRLAEAKAKWAAGEREDDLREHQRRKSAPVSPIVASLLEGGELPFEHRRKPEPKRDVRFGRVEPLSAAAYNRIAADGSDL
jgi:uncharacterized phage protein (TIGR02220 family)